MTPTALNAAAVAHRLLDRSMAKPPADPAPSIPAAERVESEEGAAALRASSGDAVAEFEMPEGNAGGFLTLDRGGHTIGMLIDDEDDARAVLAVLHRFLAERPAAEMPADHPPASFSGDPPAGWMRLTETTANWRGFRYRLIGGEWHRMFQLTATDLATVETAQ